MERKLLDMMNQLSISEYNPRMKYCDKFQFAELNIRMIRLRMGGPPYRRYLSAAHTDRYEIPVKNTTYVPKTTTYRESVEISS